MLKLEFTRFGRDSEVRDSLNRTSLTVIALKPSGAVPSSLYRWIVYDVADEIWNANANSASGSLNVSTSFRPLTTRTELSPNPEIVSWSLIATLFTLTPSRREASTASLIVTFAHTAENKTEEVSVNRRRNIT